MIDRLQRQEVQSFIHLNESSSLTRLALSKSPFLDIPMRELVEQIEGCQKSKEKIPSWSDCLGIIFPERVSMEQCSSEATARFKSQIITGKTLLDMTGGFGVDTAFLAETFQHIVYYEQNQQLAAIAQHNFKTLSLKQIDAFCGDALNYLSNNPQEHFDWIYLDPARRDENGNRVAALHDCTPDIIDHLDFLFEHTNHILLKTAPMLDIKQVITELQVVKSVYVVALKNDVREVLYLLENGFSGEPVIHAIHLQEIAQEKVTFSFSEEHSVRPIYSLPQRFLFEPNAAVLKAGAFNCVCEFFSVNKLHKNSHLYTSEISVAHFPGRHFEIIKTLEFNKIAQQELKKLEKANITVRNFPETVKQLRQKYKIKEGGEDYLFFTTLHNEKKCVIFCRKINS